VLVSLLTGGIGWAGSLVLSKQVDGFNGLAVVNTGLQWRGPILLMATLIGAVAVPAISRHHQQGEHAAINQMLRQMMVFNGAVALLASLTLIVAARAILSLYGGGFTAGVSVFALLVVSSLPQVVAGVYLQHLVATGRMWRQLWTYLYLVVPLAIGYLLFVPAYHAMGFAWTQLLAWTILAVAAMATSESSGATDRAVTARPNSNVIAGA
jgi:O-antigen/teichoic acid export membrane protein